VLLGGATTSDEPDTVVRRLQALDLCHEGPLPTLDATPVRLVHLRLEGCHLIPVIVNGQTTLWRVRVELSQGPPPPPGIMNVIKQFPNGGLFEATFPVQPRFIFNCVEGCFGPCSGQRVFDFGLAQPPIPPDVFSTYGEAPWVHHLFNGQANVCGVNFIPGIMDVNAPGAPPCCIPICHNGATATHCIVVGYDCSHCPGACCVNGVCHDLFPPNVNDQCAAMGGLFFGFGTKCSDGDGDGIPDFMEINDCCAPPTGDPCKILTDPTNPDTDGDGCLDGDEVAAGTDPCDPTSYPPMIFIDPPDGVVDARRSCHALPICPLDGIQTFLIQAPCGGSNLANWLFCENSAGGLPPNAIASVVDNGNGTVTLTLARPITPGAVTTLTFVPTGDTGRFTSHPANVNGDGFAGATDILALIDCLNGVDPIPGPPNENCPWGIYSRDLDHNGLFLPADILEEINLLNGAGPCCDPWINTPKPVNTICP
jgi:hypothetical protein